MNLPISTLSISRFRSFRKLAIGPFGRVNLITGKNNAGKSTLLEAIRILTTDGAPSTIFNILSHREEATHLGSESSGSASDLSFIASLFSDRPDISECTKPFVVSNLNGGSSPIKAVEARIAWFAEEYDPETGVRRLVPSEGVDLFGDPSGLPMLEIKTPSRTRRIRIDSRRSGMGRFPIETPDGPHVPCVYLDPFSSRSTSQLAAQWDAIALTTAEKQVVNALRIISPEIEAVSMVGGEGGGRSRTAIAKSKLFRSPVPLRSFGDGANRVFGIILSVVNAAGGVLLVDEIENGLHYSVLTDVWKVIFRMAKQLNVQVFATSHSWDCVDSFQRAANDHPETGVLARLTQRNDQIIPTLFSEKELQIAARDEIEVR